jgi:ferredoxin
MASPGEAEPAERWHPNSEMRPKRPGGKGGLIFELPARIKQSTLAPRIMADIANKYPENVPGKFYVDNQCIDCDLCRETAPNNFKRNDDGGYSFVYKQPSSPEEEAQCKEAKEGCPVEAIGDNGDVA